MKKFTAILLALVLVLGLAACSSNKPQNPQPTPQETTQEPQTQATEDPGPAPATINVIYHPTIGGSTAIATAISQGYFEEENLTVNLQMYTSGPPEIAAMVAKQADVGFIGSGAAWLAFSGQVNIIALDNIALTEEIITRADNGINSIADLKGKTVAVQEGAAGYTLLVVALQEAGISVSDVKILNISKLRVFFFGQRVHFGKGALCKLPHIRVHVGQRGVDILNQPALAALVVNAQKVCFLNR